MSVGRGCPANPSPGAKPVTPPPFRTGSPSRDVSEVWPWRVPVTRKPGPGCRRAHAAGLVTRRRRVNAVQANRSQALSINSFCETDRSSQLPRLATGRAAVTNGHSRTVIPVSAAFSVATEEERDTKLCILFARATSATTKDIQSRVRRRLANSS